VIADTPNQYKRIDESDWGSFSGNYKKYRKFIENLSQTIDTSMPGHLRDCLLENGVFLPEGSQARIEITLDTSILMKQIMGELKGYRSSLVDMVQKGFLILYAPPKLEFEIKEKIRRKISEDRQELAHSSAMRILELVTVVDDIDHRIDRMSEILLGKRDPEDVVFLAVTFQKQTHGILTADRDFEDLKNIKIWQVGTLGKIVTGLHHGSTVIWLVTKGLPAAFVLLGTIIGLIVQSIIWIGEILYGAGKHLFTFALEKAKQIPPIIPLLIIVLGVLAFALSSDLRNIAQQGLEKIMKWVSDVGFRIAETLQKLGELVRSILLNLVGELPTMIEVFGFLAYDIFNMVEQLRTLEDERAQLPEPSPYEILIDDLERILENFKKDVIDTLREKSE
jgi:predicted nucleic acid-binding protein